MNSHRFFNHSKLGFRVDKRRNIMLHCFIDIIFSAYNSRFSIKKDGFLSFHKKCEEI